MQEYEDKISDLVNVCYAYYLYGETQSKIAQKIGVSVAKVSKMIAQAQKMGIVKIQINDPIDQVNKLSEQLKARYSLKDAKVVPCSHSDRDTLLRRLGMAAAGVLASYIRNGDVIGISGGTTLYEMLEFFETPGSGGNVVVPLLGGYKEFEDTTHGSEIASEFSKKLRAQLVIMPTPGIVKEGEADSLLSNSAIKRSMAWIHKCDIAIFGIGTADSNSTFYRGGVLDNRSLVELKKENAAGCICLNFYDADGKPCNRFNSRIIGVTLNDISRIKVTIGVAGGSQQKVHAIRGALNGGYLSVLVTDQLTAQELLGPT